ncbi:MAG: hypothetical protein LBJ58_08135 [Tannerellaceae bacterium]|jgi:hypothetical protein|nr:hypothetical protein [Tannerellaceae bacterium]
MNKKKSLLWAVFFIAFRASAQIGIGTDAPDKAAILDISSEDKGVTLPRVTLKSATDNLGGNSEQPVGLLVYNTGGSLAEGFFFWNGSAWEKMESFTSIAPEITTLECEHAVLEPKSFIAGTPYSGILKVPYTGGNEGKYPGGDCIYSETNTGLKACLKAGKLDRDIGYLVYDVTGLPVASSPTGATFPIKFANVTCRVTAGVTESADITSVSSVGSLLTTSDNDVKGHHRVVSTYDGKFSVRVFVPENISLAETNLQIRSNSSDNVTIIWNGNISIAARNIIGSAGNKLTLPESGVWYGNDNETPVTVKSNNRTSWGTAVGSMPVQRTYIWTGTDVSDKTVYHLTLMMGSSATRNMSSDFTKANQTKIFMRLEQMQAD